MDSPKNQTKQPHQTITSGTHSYLGRYQAHSLATSYTSLSDGFVLAGIAPPDDVNGFNITILQGLVDDNLVASATAGNFGSFDSIWNYTKTTSSSSFLMPIPVGAIWRVECIQYQDSSEKLDTWVNWIPLCCDTPDEAGAIASGHRRNTITTSKPWVDFDPAINNLVNLLERVFKQSLSNEDKIALVQSIKQLI